VDQRHGPLPNLIHQPQEHRRELGDRDIGGDEALTDEVLARLMRLAPREAGTIAVIQNVGILKRSYFYDPLYDESFF